MREKAVPMPTEADWAQAAKDGLILEVTTLRERNADLEALNGELEAALTPFAEFGKMNVDADGWTSNIHREQISTWFGPSDFRRAAGLVKD